jgi:hypothetical protein
MVESKLLTQLNLSPDEHLHPPPVIGKLKTINEWASAAIDAVKDNTSFADALKELSPFAEVVFSAAKESFAAIKFVTKVFDELTKIQEPEQLARLALTLSYQAAAEAALRNAGTPTEVRISRIKLDDSVDDIDLLDLDPKRIDSHAFVQKADRILVHYLPQAGYSPDQVAGAIRQIHASVQNQFATLLSHGKTKDKFEPLTRWLSLPSDQRLFRAALRRHAEYTSWLFRKAPVLQREPYALQDVCIEAECSKLTHVQLRDSTKGKPRPNPFLEGEENGGRHKLLETVMGYIYDPKFQEPIVIQGSAGSGKSTFTLRLADHLREEGFTPIRIRLRDVVLGKEFYTQFGEAITYQNDDYLTANERFIPASNPLSDGTVLQDVLPFNGGSLKVCPYVLILDGWDEISVAVSEGLKIRVKDLLLRIRSEFFKSAMRVRVILTGRPSDAIDDCTEFFRDQTPMLTIRTLNPEELPKYANKLRRALTERPVRFEGASAWKFPEEALLNPIYKRYGIEFKAEKQQTEEQVPAGTAAVLGYPLLLHVTFRLLAEPEIDPTELLESPAALLRKLTDFATATADKPSDAEPGAKILTRISGMSLRQLLRKTAGFMSALGQEAISKEELKRRLKTHNVDEIVKGVTQDNLISAMLVSFYFKGGNTDLGCEFTHKAIREYLFAEEIVEQLKQFARLMRDDLPERPAHLYWRDFEQTDPRHKASDDLAALLAPQWLTAEVVAYLESLIEWEAERCLSDSAQKGSTGETEGLNPAEWRRLRTLLVDLWDWWAEGVHMRPQPQINDKSGQLEWQQSSVEGWIPRSKPFDVHALENIPEPMRSTTLDAHLGDALFRLCAWVHFFGLRSAAGEPRRFQSLQNDQLRFRPGGDDINYFGFFANRINAAGWRVGGSFPSGVSADAVDLSNCVLQGLSFRNCRLNGSLWSGATIFCCNIGPASLLGADFSRAMIHSCRFFGASLDESRFAGTTLFSNIFVGGSIKGAQFEGVLLRGVYAIDNGPIGIDVPKNQFLYVRGADSIQNLRTDAEVVTHTDRVAPPPPNRKRLKASERLVEAKE